MDRRSHIKSVHQKRQEETKKNVLGTLRMMEREEIPITFASVSRMSGVSVGILYYHEDVKKEIVHARDAHRRSSSKRASASGVGTAREMYQEIKTLRMRISQLEEEVRMNEIFLEPSWTHDYFDSE